MAKRKKNITIVVENGGDWEGIYIDGKLVYQNHSIEWTDLVKYLGLQVDVEVMTDEYVEKYGRFPATIEECDFEQGE